MKFRLSYSGSLKSRNSSKTKDKWVLRKEFHEQLKELWTVHPTLASWINNDEHFLIEKFGRSFRPLAVSGLHLFCSLEILFLRRGEPGKAIKRGDIDNRIKTLIDGLRLPQSIEEMADIKNHFSEGEVIYCLLEDDDRILHFSVETDTLLKPKIGEEPQTQADVMLTVEVKPTLVTFDAVGFLS